VLVNSRILFFMTTNYSEIQTGNRFEFGKNWNLFLNELTEDRILLAEESLKELLSVKTLNGQKFLDAGSGSGLFSLAARRLGAKVTSFDYDPISVQCTQELKNRFFTNDVDWTVDEGSVLDAKFIATLGEFDIVYSWGVLHHTGAMNQAFDIISEAVSSRGALVIAIYNDQGRASVIWYHIKKLYNKSPIYLKWILLSMCFLRLWGPTTLFDFFRMRPFYTWRNYAKNSTRGMSAWRDVVDWVGGFPFEVAKPDTILDYFSKKSFALEKMKTVSGGLGCNEYVLRLK
jgi:2-polyprenyl-3-methyl-5-hydroxy-6-metoxy-1,4-benzoquinol methylase